MAHDGQNAPITIPSGDVSHEDSYRCPSSAVQRAGAKIETDNPVGGWLSKYNGFLFVNRAAPDRTIRVLIAEDHTLMAEGLRTLLEREFESVTTVGSGRELVDTVAVSKPPVALVDIAMPLLNGIEATRRLCKISPATKVIIVTVRTEPQYVVEAFRAGASGFALKRCAIAELVIATRRVLAGRTYVTPMVANRVIEAVRSLRWDRRSRPGNEKSCN